MKHLPIKLTSFPIILLLGMQIASCSKKADTIDPGNQNPPPPPIETKKWYVTTILDAETSGYVDGVGSNAQFLEVYQIAIDSKGDLYLADGYNKAVRKISNGNVVSTYAGSKLSTPTPAFGAIYGVTIDPFGNIYTGELTLVRKVISGNSSEVLAGESIGGQVDGVGTDARFWAATKISSDKSGNIYFCDLTYYPAPAFNLKKITPAGQVTTLPVSDNTGILDDPYHGPYIHSIAVDLTGNIYYSSDSGNAVKKRDPQGNVILFAGSNIKGFKDGSGSAASFASITDLACDSTGNVWVCDGNHAIRRISPSGEVKTIVGTGDWSHVDGDSTKATFMNPMGITFKNNTTAYVCEFSGSIRKLEYK